ncbi:hypothetical protein HKW70_32915, partial [Pseudomonas aeruginosa]|nr:hypothetical protein [Pseudomonas aeruginosa]
MKTMADNYCALLMDANAKLAEMERQEPVALANRGTHAFWMEWTEAAAGLYGPGIKLYAHPVAQAQHSVPEGFRLNEALAVALARVSELETKLTELEKQEPVAVVKGDGSLGAGFPSGTKLYAAPVAQAQQLNDLDKQCRDDVARALGLRPNQERGFA